MQHQVEIAISVSDFNIEGMDTPEIFQAAEKPGTDTIKKEFEEMVKDLLSKSVSVSEKEFEFIDWEFVEFDSSNWTHAGAYYLVTYKEPIDLDGGFMEENLKDQADDGPYGRIS